MEGGHLVKNWGYLSTSKGIVSAVLILLHIAAIALTFITLFVPLCKIFGTNLIVNLKDMADRGSKNGSNTLGMTHLCSGAYINHVTNDYVAAWFFTTLAFSVAFGIATMIILSKDEKELNNPDWKSIRIVLSGAIAVATIVTCFVGYIPILLLHIDLQSSYTCEVVLNTPPKNSVTCGAPHFYDASIAFIICIVIAALHSLLVKMEWKTRKESQEV